MKKMICVMFFLMGATILSANSFLPNHQLSFFAIDGKLLKALSKTISNNQKFLIMFSLKRASSRLDRVQRVLKEKQIDFKVVEYPQNKRQVYIKINGKNGKNSMNIIESLGVLRARFFVGKNLIPLDQDFSTYITFSKDTVFTDEIQDKYLIAKIMDYAASAKKSNYFLENVIESYMNDFFNRNSILASQKITYSEDGEEVYTPTYVGDYGPITNADYTSMEKLDRYKNTLFSKTFRKVYAQKFDKEFSLEKQSLRLKKIANDREWLEFFNKAFLENAYNCAELKSTKNSKGVSIFCVDSDIKMCKTKEELEKILSKQNMFFGGVR